MADPICIGDFTSLYRLQKGVLDSIGALLSLNPKADKKAPARQYVSVGDPAFDICPQLTVHATNIRMNPGNVFPDGTRFCTGEYLVDINVTLLRCYVTGESIPPKAFNDAAEVFNFDAALMYWGFECKLLNQDPELSSLIGACKLQAPGIMNPITAQSGVSGWQWTWTFVIPSC